jgi:hypothetical protein
MSLGSRKETPKKALTIFPRPLRDQIETPPRPTQPTLRLVNISIKRPQQTCVHVQLIIDLVRDISLRPS